MILSEITVPLLNANEPEARLAGVHVKDGVRVLKGDILFTIETTKAAAEIEAPVEGYLRLLAAEGDVLPVGARVAVLTSTPEEPLPAFDSPKSGTPPPGELRITRPARALAEQLGLDLTLLPTDRLVTEAVVRELAGASGRAVRLEGLDPARALLIYGAGGHAKAVMEMARAMGGFQIVGILDDKIPAGTQVLGIPVLGTRALLAGLVEQGLRLAANGVGGIVDINVRVRIFELLEASGFSFPALVHPRATVEPSATVGEGTQVFANAYVGSSAVLHPRCMVNTGAIVSHDCEIGSYSHVAPGAMLAGHVHVGERALVGMGVTTAIGVSIGDGARVGNGAALLADVPPRTIVPVGKVWTGS